MRWVISFALIFAPSLSHAIEPVSARKPVPRMQVLPLPRGEASVQDNGRELTRFIFDSSLNRPFLYPIVGPSGRSLTRMGHPRDPNGHSHHNSVWISHHLVGDAGIPADAAENDPRWTGFWNDASKGRIAQRRVVQYEDSDDEALIQTENDWVGAGGKALLKEVRTMRFHPLEDKQWLLVIDLELAPPKNAAPVKLGKTPFGPIGVRMAKTIGVHDGGGTIRNSEGGVNEKEVFWKPARWVDYSGLIAPDVVEGITLMDHPSNPKHPNEFHVRDDGWMGACITFDGARTIAADEPLKLRYGLLVHAGAPSGEQLNGRFEEFAKIGDPPRK
jgi:hypothetical protein